MQYLEQSFTDIDQYGPAMGWDIEIRQMEAGTTRMDMKVLAGQHWVLHQHDFDCNVFQGGTTTEGLWAWAMVPRGRAPFRWCGKQVESPHLLTLNRDSGYETVTPRGHKGFTLGFSHAFVTEMAESQGQEIAAIDGGDLPPFYAVDPAMFDTLVCYLSALLREFSEGTSGIGAQVEKQIESELLVRLIAPLNNCPESSRRLSLCNRSRALRRAIDYIEAHRDEAIQIKELCSAAHTTWSTLERAFQDAYGICPKKYLLLLRLHSVRRTLRDDSAVSRVYEAANRWGFWHMGQFARDYRRLFGELPSQTLAQSGLAR